MPAQWPSSYCFPLWASFSVTIVMRIIMVFLLRFMSPRRLQKPRQSSPGPSAC